MTNTLYQSWGFPLLMLYALSSAFSIVLSQIFLILLLLLWLKDIFVIYLKNEISFANISSSFKKIPSPLIYLYSPLLTWIVLSFYSALAGINTPHSIEEVLKTTVFSLLPLVTCHIFYSFKDKNLFTEKLQILSLCFAGSFSLSSLHSIISSSYGFEIQPKIPGPVTESGQLALIVPLLLGFLISKNIKTKKNYIYFFIGLFVILITLAWPNILFTSITIKNIFWLLLILTLSYFAYNHRENKEQLFSLAFTLCLAALLVNLKRGPWLGVFSSLIVLGVFYSKKLALYAITLALGALILISPIRDRAMEFWDHFSIEGGRKEIWNLGFELAYQYPLGIGLDNAEIIQEIDPSLPDSHRHMHNNLLNILVETGWLGLIIFCIWLKRIFFYGLIQKSKELKNKGNVFNVLIFCQAASLFSWQMAGLVEYNFGDGEVRLLAFCIFGIILASAIKDDRKLLKNKI